MKPCYVVAIFTLSIMIYKTEYNDSHMIFLAFILYYWYFV